jgi:hypothetical protein
MTKTVNIIRQQVYGYIKRKDINESYYFLLGILNSSLLWFFIRNTGYVLRGGYCTYKTNYVNPFPLPAKFGIEDVDYIEQRVIKILANNIYPNKENILLENEINERIYNIYGLTLSDICVIEAFL